MVTEVLDKREVIEGLREVINNCLNSSLRQKSTGNMIGANRLLESAGTMILRYEFYALKVSGEEEHLKALKEQYWNVSKQLGVNLQE